VVELKQYSRQILEKRLTGRLGTLYMNFFILLQNFPEAERQLNLVTEVLASHPMDETVQLYKHMKKCLNERVAVEDYQRAIVFRDMMTHYKRHVLG